MNLKINWRAKGFTLLEMLLVITIGMSVVYLGLAYMQQKARDARIDRTVLQLEQVLSAATAYYADNNTWPTNDPTGNLTGLLPTYLPQTIPSPYLANLYQTYSATPLTLFYAYVKISSSATATQVVEANMIAGRLPLGFASQNAPSGAYTACATGSPCFVLAAIGVPSQNLSNAGGIKFAGLFHHGACIPLPSCSVDAGGATLTPQVFVMPVSISGINDASNIYPLTSVSAYATGGTNTTPPDCSNAPGYVATYSAGSNDCTSVANAGPAVTKYWRACVKIMSMRGDVTTTQTSANNAWASSITLVAFTRCAIPNEAAGSTFSIYSN